MADYETTMSDRVRPLSNTQAVDNKKHTICDCKNSFTGC